MESQEFGLSGSQPHTESYAIITQLELLGILQVGPSAATENLKFILQQSNRKTDLSLRQVWWLNHMNEFINWYHKAQSSILLVDGYLDHMPSDRISPLSIFNSSFILKFVQSPSRIMLFFFSGLYDGEGLERDRNFQGPSGLVRSLIAQLLCNESFSQPDLSFLTTDWIEACEMNDIKALCQLFKCLVFQIPTDMQLFCILDELAVYECDPRWSDEIDYVAALFQHITLITGRGDKPVVKTL